MDTTALQQEIDNIKGMLSSCKTPGETVLFSILLDTKLDGMGEDGQKIAEAIRPLVQVALKKFSVNPNTTPVEYRVGGTA